MFLWFFEMLFWGLVTLAQATWRRTSCAGRKPFAWLKRYAVWFVLTLVLVAVSPRRSGLFVALYAWFRPIDDILDGEDPNPPTDMTAFIQEKQLLLSDCINDKEVHARGRDRMLLIIYHLARQLNLEKTAKRYTFIVWEHMVMDYRWRTKGTIPSRQTLATFARLQDESIFRLAALVLGVSESTFAEINFDAIGVFTRTDWISDIHRDLDTGLIHFSREDCELLGITPAELINPSTRKRALAMLIKKELLELKPLWKQVIDQRPQFLASFPNPLIACLYDRFMLRVAICEAERLCKKHGVTLR